MAAAPAAATGAASPPGPHSGKKHKLDEDNGTHHQKKEAADSHMQPVAAPREVKDQKEWFPFVSAPIRYDPRAAASNVLVFRHYNAEEKVMGRTMADWCRFAVCYWHTFRGIGVDIFGQPTMLRPWDDGTDSIENHQRRMRAAFEFFTKLGVRYYTFHDRDIAPEGKTWAETSRNLDTMAAYAKKLQDETGIKCLWATSNLFSNKRYMNGAATNPDAHVFACAAAQVKKCMDIAKMLGAENFVFWGGREGYQTLLNTDVKRELDHAASFFRMCVAYKKKIGFNGQLLIEPKPKEPTKHQYDYDAQTVIGFLKTYHLDADFKLNIEPNHTTMAGHSYEHDIEVASKYGFLGSIDANTGDSSLGWDTDQFPMDLKNCFFLMKTIIEQKGLQPGGLNFDCKVRRESTELEDMFAGHIGAMDCFARALRNAAQAIADGTFSNILKQRYASYDSGLGACIENGTATLEDCESFVMQKGEPATTSGHQERCEVLCNQIAYK